MRNKFSLKSKRLDDSRQCLKILETLINGSLLALVSRMSFGSGFCHLGLGNHGDADGTRVYDFYEDFGLSSQVGYPVYPVRQVDTRWEVADIRKTPCCPNDPTYSRIPE